jgi:hypothetical protein
MKFELWSKNDGFLLLGVLFLVIVTVFGVILVEQRQAELDNQRTIQLTIHRPAPQQIPAHQPRRSRREPGQ